MSAPIISFGQIRLSGSNITTSSGRLLVGAATTMMVSDSGAFTSAAVVANSGQQAWTAANNNGINLSGALTQTGVQLANTAAATYATLSNVTQTGVQLANTAAATYATLTNVTTSGAQLGSSITALSGWANTTFLQKGSDLSYTTGLATGFDSFNVLLPTGFSGKPRILCDMEVSGGFAYAHNIGLVTNSGFQLYLSDIVAEPGVIAHVSARY